MQLMLDHQRFDRDSTDRFYADIIRRLYYHMLLLGVGDPVDDLKLDLRALAIAQNLVFPVDS